MRRLVLAAACLLVADAAAEPQSFSSTEGRFTIQMPGPAKEEISPVPTQLGTQRMHLIASTIGKSMFAVTYVDVPPQVLKAAKSDKLLDKAIQGAVNNIKDARLVNEQAVQLGRYPGREVSIAAPGTEIHQRFYIVKNRLYQLLIAAAQGAVTDAQVGAFFQSFKVR